MSRKQTSTILLAAVILAGATTGAARSQVPTRASLSSSGAEGNSYCLGSDISGAGRLIVFSSGSSNLVPGDLNDRFDVFVHDRVAGTTSRVSVSSQGEEANDTSLTPVISRNGRYVAFESWATNLVSNDTNGKGDVFLRDLQQGTTVRVDVDSSGHEAARGGKAPAMSADGRYVVFESDSDDLVLGDTNGESDVFLRDTVFATTERISVASDGSEANGTSVEASISPRGDVVVFTSNASNLVPDDRNGVADVFVHDLPSAVTTRASTGPTGGDLNGWSTSPVITDDLVHVVFVSFASDLVPNDSNGLADVFEYDRRTGATICLSVDPSGGTADKGSFNPDVSADGRFVVFDSEAMNLVDRESPHISADGRHVALESSAALESDDHNLAQDIYDVDCIRIATTGVPQSPSPFGYRMAGALGEAGHQMVIFLSATGTAGFPLPDGRRVPLTFDAATTVGISFLLLHTGWIDSAGNATTLSFQFPQVPPGITIDDAAVTATPLGHIASITAPITFTTQ